VIYIGNDNNNNIARFIRDDLVAVINTAHTNNGIFSIVKPGNLMFIIVAIKLILFINPFWIYILVLLLIYLFIR
jgi:hypothetical protein